MIATKANPVQFTKNSWDISYSGLLDSSLQEVPFAEQNGTVLSGSQNTLTIVASEGGTTDPLSGTHAYSNGTTVEVNAVSDTGYFFDHWILDGAPAGSANPISILMATNHTLSPVFSPMQYSGTIHIRADGKVDPPDVPLSTLDNVTYTFTGSISGSTIIIERNNTIIDGNGHTLQGSGVGEGFSLYNVNNVTIRDVNIKGFDRGVYFYSTRQSSVSGNNVTGNNYIGIYLYGSYNTVSNNNVTANSGDGLRLEISSNNIISENVVADNHRGIILDHSSNNILVENSITGNSGFGVYLDSSSNNTIYHNNLTNNTNQVQINYYGDSSTNHWDDGSEGNYWSNYTGADSNHDGIGDSPHVVDTGNVDFHPLTGMFSNFRCAESLLVTVISNSTINDFSYFGSNNTIKMHVSNATATPSFGFCRLCIPHELMDVTKLQVTIDDGHTPIVYENYDAADNGTHRWIYFVYEHSTHEITIRSDTTPPKIRIVLPENKTYLVNTVLLNFTVDEPTSWIGYRVDGQNNITVVGNTTVAGLTDGLHTIVVYANDTVGNMGASDVLPFTVDTIPPSINVVLPENATYMSSSVPLNFTVNKPTSWSRYSLDGQNNITIATNTTLSGLSDGAHYVVVYANDTGGRIGASDVIRFLVDTVPPSISDVHQTPSGNSVLPQDETNVDATVTDNASGVKRVTLICAYTNSSGTWAKIIGMTSPGQNVYSATIPRFPYGTNVTYVIVAEDSAGNIITTEDAGHQYYYSVVPEFPSFMILPLFVVLTLLAIIAFQRKNKCPLKSQRNN
jgi:parallel beta-helix repeat protein